MDVAGGLARVLADDVRHDGHEAPVNRCRQVSGGDDLVALAAAAASDFAGGLALSVAAESVARLGAGWAAAARAASSPLSWIRWPFTTAER